MDLSRAHLRSMGMWPVPTPGRRKAPGQMPFRPVTFASGRARPAQKTLKVCRRSTPAGDRLLCSERPAHQRSMSSRRG